MFWNKDNNAQDNQRAIDDSNVKAEPVLNLDSGGQIDSVLIDNPREDRAKAGVEVQEPAKQMSVLQRMQSAPKTTLTDTREERVTTTKKSSLGAMQQQQAAVPSATPTPDKAETSRLRKRAEASIDKMVAERDAYAAGQKSPLLRSIVLASYDSTVPSISGEAQANLQLYNQALTEYGHNIAAWTQAAKTNAQVQAAITDKVMLQRAELTERHIGAFIDETKNMKEEEHYSITMQSGKSIATMEEAQAKQASAIAERLSNQIAISELDTDSAQAIANSIFTMGNQGAIDKVVANTLLDTVATSGKLGLDYEMAKEQLKAAGMTDEAARRGALAMQVPAIWNSFDIAYKTGNASIGFNNTTYNSAALKTMASVKARQDIANQNKEAIMYNHNMQLAAKTGLYQPLLDKELGNERSVMEAAISLNSQRGSIAARENYNKSLDDIIATGSTNQKVAAQFVKGGMENVDYDLAYDVASAGVQTGYPTVDEMVNKRLLSINENLGYDKTPSDFEKTLESALTNTYEKFSADIVKRGLNPLPEAVFNSIRDNAAALNIRTMSDYRKATTGEQADAAREIRRVIRATTFRSAGATMRVPFDNELSAKQFAQASGSKVDVINTRDGVAFSVPVNGNALMKTIVHKEAVKFIMTAGRKPTRDEMQGQIMSSSNTIAAFRIIAPQYNEKFIDSAIDGAAAEVASMLMQNQTNQVPAQGQDVKGKR